MAKAARQRVAVVGTGMAGLIVSHLLNQDTEKRYDVQVFESGSSPSLDSASVSVQDAEGKVSRIDVPMRALTSGYYPTLKAMYDFLGIRYKAQKMRFVFTQHLESQPKSPIGVPYFIHASNNHHFPPTRPQSLSTARYVLELIFVATFYIWFTICCWLVKPSCSNLTGLPETLEEYLARVRMPSRFAALYLLPLMSAVATCSHQELLSFPASDLVAYRKAILFGEHLVVCGGVQEVQNTLTKGLSIHLRSKVVEVRPTSQGVVLAVDKQSTAQRFEQTFDQVILAVPPNVASSIFQPAEKQLQCLPTREVTTQIHFSSVIADMNRNPEAEDIYLSTSREAGGWTNATHYHGGGISVTSNCGGSAVVNDVTSESRFTRTLRTPMSKAIVDHAFEGRARDLRGPEKMSRWTNGADGVWMTGAWCWDGMVLLEGAAVSATRVAKAFDVEIPWKY